MTKSKRFPARQEQRPAWNPKYTRFLGQPVALEEVGPPGVLRAGLMLLAVLVFGFIGWAAVTKLTESTRAIGFVTPTGSVRSVQHLEGGIVAEILVRDGALVEPGAVLVRLDATAARADLREKQIRLAALDVQAERLRAFAYGRKPNYDSIAPEYRALVADQLVILDLQEEARRQQRRVLELQVKQRKAELSILRNDRKTLINRIKIISEMLEMRRKLLRKGLVSRFLYLGTKQELNTATGDRRKNRADTVRAKQSIAEAEGRLAQIDAELRNDAVVQMGVVSAELAQLRHTVVRLHDRVDRLEITAPVRGVVKGLTVNTVGGIIPTGGVIAEIVPVDSDLIVEAQFSPSDVGHLEIGQTASVKVQTFDFARYGSVEGVLEQLSATTFKEPDGTIYYKGIIRLSQSHVGDNPIENMILPGMTVDIDVNTGERTLLRYLLRPVYESMDRALAER
jgi:HlyD family secretion protein/adhesin transport system membrane fusion protein